MSGWTVIVNGAAGRGRAAKLAPAVLERLRAGGAELEVRETAGPGHATELARAAAAGGARRFLAVGGDGTAFETLNGLFPREPSDPVVLGQIPLGTGNSFLRDFDQADPEAAVRAVLSGRTRRVDVVRAEHRTGAIHYLNLLSVGFSADVGALTNRRLKRFGAAGYGMAVVARVAGLRHPAFPLRADDGPVDARPCVLLSFSNSRFTGGTMMMAPAAAVDDGALDLIRVGPLSRWRLLRAFPRIYRGTHLALPAVEAGRARVVEFPEGGETEVMVDGEVIRLALRRLEVLPGVLEVPG